MEETNSFRMDRTKDVSTQTSILLYEDDEDTDLQDAFGTDALSKMFLSKEPAVSAKPTISPPATTSSQALISASLPPRKDSLTLLAPDADERYFMNHPTRGIALIINNKNFLKQLDLPSRTGSDVDADSLEAAFRSLKFQRSDIHRYDDLTTYDMMSAMKHFAGENYENMDCFVCAILTHGKENTIYGYDGKVALDDLWEPFKRNQNPTLFRKPKIFLVQACRGAKFDEGFGMDVVEADAPLQRLSLEADFLYAFSTVPGYFSWRNSIKGSWFIQAFIKVVKENGHRLGEIDLLQLLTRVNYHVAYHFESNVPGQPKMHQKKQMPSIVSMLTKQVYFT